MAEKSAVTLTEAEIVTIERILTDRDGEEALAFLDAHVMAKLAEGRRVRDEHSRLHDRNVKS